MIGDVVLQLSARTDALQAGGANFSSSILKDLREQQAKIPQPEFLESCYQTNLVTLC